MPTFEEILALRTRLAAELGRPIGVYPETKHPTYFDSIGKSLEEPLVATLKRHGMNSANAKVFIQSFEINNLRELNTKTPVRLVQLVNDTLGPYDQFAAGTPITYAEMVTPAGLAKIAGYADGLGANKWLVIPKDAAGNALPPTTVVRDAHRAGLRVHVWTLRDENQFMAKNWWRGSDPNAKGDSFAEARAFLDAGVDGLFTDYTDTIVEARNDWLATR